MSVIATFLSECPRCHGVSLVDDAYGPVDECVVCGYYAGDNFQRALPHFGYAYRFRAPPTRKTSRRFRKSQAQTWPPSRRG